MKTFIYSKRKFVLKTFIFGKILSKTFIYFTIDVVIGRILEVTYVLYSAATRRRSYQLHCLACIPAAAVAAAAAAAAAATAAMDLLGAMSEHISLHHKDGLVRILWISLSLMHIFFNQIL